MSESRNISIRRLLLPKDTNHRGEIFGGAILAEIDLAGAIEARRHTKHDVATMAVKSPYWSGTLSRSGLRLSKSAPLRSMYGLKLNPAGTGKTCQSA